MLLASKNLCDDLQCILGGAYNILPCHNPKAAPEILQRHPDVLIISLLLPGTDGLQFLKEHAASLPRRILVLTSWMDDHILEELCRLNVDFVFRLPTKADSLRQKLDDLYTKKRPS